MTGLIALSLAWVYPLVAVMRGRRLAKTVVITWGLVVAYVVALCFLLPGVVSLFSAESGREMLNRWVPEGPGVIAVMFVGWFPPLVAGSLGYAIRRLRERFTTGRTPKG